MIRIVSYAVPTPLGITSVMLCIVVIYSLVSWYQFIFITMVIDIQAQAAFSDFFPHMKKYETNFWQLWSKLSHFARTPAPYSVTGRAGMATRAFSEPLGLRRSLKRTLWLLGIHSNSHLYRKKKYIWYGDTYIPQMSRLISWGVGRDNKAVMKCVCETTYWKHFWRWHESRGRWVKILKISLRTFTSRLAVILERISIIYIIRFTP